MSFHPRSVLRWIPALLWMGVIFYWSSQSSTPAQHWIISKIAHVAEYSILAWLFAFALLPRRAWLLVAWWLATLYAISDEIHQAFTPQRHPSALDVALDSAAALVALLALRQALSVAQRWRPGAEPSDTALAGHPAERSL